MSQLSGLSGHSWFKWWQESTFIVSICQLFFFLRDRVQIFCSYKGKIFQCHQSSYSLMISGIRTHKCGKYIQYAFNVKCMRLSRRYFFHLVYKTVEGLPLASCYRQPWGKYTEDVVPSSQKLKSILWEKTHINNYNSTWQVLWWNVYRMLPRGSCCFAGQMKT